MPDKKPVSIYLSPLASSILSQYVEMSGYRSISRTVEEIILAFDDIYSTLATHDQAVNEQEQNDPGNLRLILPYTNSISIKGIKRTLARLKKPLRMISL